MSQSITSNAVAIATPDLEIIEGQITTTSNQVAEHFGKRHADVIRAIRKLDAPAEFTERNFALSEFTDSTGRVLPAYRITRDGFTLLAMGFTGKEAMQWKVAYLTAFNQMEAQLLAQATRPHNPALDYDRISPAQAQDLKEIVAAIVKAGVQTYGETWARLQRKFRVNSYLELPATNYEAARTYLLAKLPTEPHQHTTEAAPMQQAPTPDTLAAFEAAARAGAAVQMQVFNALMRGEAPSSHQRYMLGIDIAAHPGTASQVDLKPVPHDAYILTLMQFARGLASDILASNAELAAINAASSQRLSKRLGQPAALTA